LECRFGSHFIIVEHSGSGDPLQAWTPAPLFDLFTNEANQLLVYLCLQKWRSQFPRGLRLPNGCGKMRKQYI
jgi:hypothetical protein